MEHDWLRRLKYERVGNDVVECYRKRCSKSKVRESTIE